MPGHLRLLYLSLLLTRLADQILLFTVPLVVFKLSGSAAWSGIAFFCEALPRYAAFPVCGALCDRVSTLKLIRWSQRWRSIVCVGGVLGFAVHGSLAWLVVISAGAGVLTTQGFMAREAMLPRIFHGDAYRKSLSYTQIADQLGTVLGPLAAAGLLGISHWEYVVLAAAAIFLVSDITFSLWAAGRQIPMIDREEPRRNWLAPYRIAFMHIVAIPGLLEVSVLAAGVNLVVGVTLATSAAMFTGVYGQTASAYAWLQVAGSIATVVVLMFVAHVKLPARASGATSYLLIVLGGLLTGWVSLPFVYAAGFVAVIGFDKMFSVFMRGVRQRLIPAEDFGKTVGLIALLNNLTQPLAGLLVGFFAARLGTASVILALTLWMASIGIALVARAAPGGRRAAWLANIEEA
ncbi:MFS transporter [Paraburkholderia silvatlantica]|uniref:MFS family permease n=1 Tax=Paraburkholderia silvatlantica TaxID=321895 RepID=A0A2U1A7J7_9BURK|nr:MFS transporter [Paraburkholderia silvatlantica]MBB2931323.1 MFS family permease [Paraburkholderia silvatlantica]PVY28243.1 MFS transporter [Paraburkholderia silvatlantica]PXW34928.1 MFS transporter [Paraburkholderia silvatlantica]PYE15235.1 MFS transporter [Paraburkholderia silvatlantica]TDQ98835.1 MFS transporter [Paraburkholderia silvatlantica]